MARSTSRCRTRSSSTSGASEEQTADSSAEHSRVGRRWVITTPNRWFPVESHTRVVFRHYSPSWRAQRREFTRLLSKKEFVELVGGPIGGDVVGSPVSPTFTGSR